MSYTYKLFFVGMVLLVQIFCYSGTAQTEDTYFDISFDRSVSISVPEGTKKISAIGDMVTINKKGRLWLTGNETREGYVDIVCQNLSTEPVNVELKKLSSPWVEITGKTKCGDWQKNILICSVGEMERGVFCKIAEKENAGSGEGGRKQLTASVSVRAAEVQEGQQENLSEEEYLQSRVDYYTSGIDLCGVMHNKTGDIFISWVIYNGGAVDQVRIGSQTAEKDREIAGCIAEQVSLWRFPEWENDAQVSYQF